MIVNSKTLVVPDDYDCKNRERLAIKVPLLTVISG